MLFIAIKIVLLLSSIVIPLGAQKTKPNTSFKFRIDTDTKDALYAINVNGMLERIQRNSMSDQVDL
ncbi:hypothetical protein [Mucilaginibacter sp.]|uniref:hypothetical protein n=1 Tax=Mucilaginibacter sp. TaxID=1882438 RepID=UPI002632DF80|nr:hypothetical protein [Mucilaginibacter sp.]MDB5031099.1 hypothetical protein [Mucilaginibacter sp.]